MTGSEKAAAAEQSARSLRLTFSYRGQSIELTSQQPVETPAAESDPTSGYASQRGFWFELRDAEDQPIYRRVMQNPLRGGVELVSSNPELAGRRIDASSGIFTLLAPDLDDARTLALFASPRDPKHADRPAAEIARFPLRSNRDVRNPVLLQSRSGKRGNFEVIFPPATGGVAHYWRDNDDVTMPWRGPVTFGQALGKIAAVAMIESNLGGTRSLEVVARIGDKIAHFWRDGGPRFGWHGPIFFGAGVTGVPALIQSRYGAAGNFEVLIPRAGGGIAHYWRDNDRSGFPWNGPIVFGGPRAVDAVSLIQSNLGAPGPLEAIAKIGDRLAHFWRDTAPPFAWNGPVYVASGVSGAPALLQSRFGKQGSFEVVAPSAAGGLVHYWRDNDRPGFPWSAPASFAASLGQVSAVSLIESNYTKPGNLEVVVRAGDRLAHLWRDTGPRFAWTGPFFIPL